MIKRTLMMLRHKWHWKVKVNSLFDKAVKFATEAHGDQVRKYSGVPYIEHPLAVAKIVKQVPHTEEMLAAAVLHDVVEDTDISLKTIENFFGPVVANLVYYLTDISVPEDGNRKIRKEKDAFHYASGPAEAQTIKVADLLDNTADIYKHDPKFWEVYKQEKWFSLNLLVDADPQLWERAKVQLKECW